jgi:hypothetical protein
MESKGCKIGKMNAMNDLVMRGLADSWEKFTKYKHHFKERFNTCVKKLLR